MATTAGGTERREGMGRQGVKGEGQAIKYRKGEIEIMGENLWMMACESEREGQSRTVWDGGKEEGAMQPLLQLGNKLLQPQRQPQLQKLAWYVHYYLQQIYTARQAHSRGSRGCSKSMDMLTKGGEQGYR